jgi:hypothetical protein
MTLLESYEVTLDTGTIVVIENPSIFVKLGQLFIRKISGKPDTMTVHTNHATILDKGTSFFVRVPRSDSAQVFVAEGAVTVSPNGGPPWPDMVYRAGEGGTFVGDRPPVRMRVPQSTINAELSWVRRVDDLTRVRMPKLDSLTENQARDALSRVGLKVLFVQKKITGAAAPGYVIEQSPLAGEYASRGSFVTFVVEDQPKPSRPSGETPTATPPRSCTVPNIMNLSEAAAIKAITDAGYRARRQGEGGDYVSKQSPVASEPTPCLRTIVYNMGRRIL